MRPVHRERYARFCVVCAVEEKGRNSTGHPPDVAYSDVTASTVYLLVNLDPKQPVPHGECTSMAGQHLRWAGDVVAQVATCTTAVGPRGSPCIETVPAVSASSRDGGVGLCAESPKS